MASEKEPALSRPPQVSGLQTHGEKVANATRPAPLSGLMLHWESVLAQRPPCLIHLDDEKPAVP